MVDRAPFEKEEDWGRTDANLPWKRERKGRGAWDGVGRIQGGGWDGTDESLPSGTRKTGGRWNPKVVQTTGDWRFPHPMERDHPRKKVGHPPPTVEKEYTSPHSPPHDRTGVLHGIGRDAPIEKERRIGNWTGNETVHAQEHLHGCRGGGMTRQGRWV